MNAHTRIEASERLTIPRQVAETVALYFPVGSKVVTNEVCRKLGYMIHDKEHSGIAAALAKACDRGNLVLIDQPTSETTGFTYNVWRVVSHWFDTETAEVVASVPATITVVTFTPGAEGATLVRDLLRSKSKGFRFYHSELQTELEGFLGRPVGKGMVGGTLSGLVGNGLEVVSSDPRAERDGKPARGGKRFLYEIVGDIKEPPAHGGRAGSMAGRKIKAEETAEAAPGSELVVVPAPVEPISSEGVKPPSPPSTKTARERLRAVPKLASEIIAAADAEWQAVIDQNDRLVAQVEELTAKNEDLSTQALRVIAKGETVASENDDLRRQLAEALARPTLADATQAEIYGALGRFMSPEKAA